MNLGFNFWNEIWNYIFSFNDLVNKFPNAEIEMYELSPHYDSAKSFYGKAIVVKINNDVFLVSYDTVVASFNEEEKIMRIDDTYSATTLRHIKEFLKQNGFKAETKKQIENDYMKEVA